MSHSGNSNSRAVWRTFEPWGKDKSRYTRDDDSYIESHVYVCVCMCHYLDDSPAAGQRNLAVDR